MPLRFSYCFWIELPLVTVRVANGKRRPRSLRRKLPEWIGCHWLHVPVSLAILRYGGRSPIPWRIGRAGRAIGLSSRPTPVWPRGALQSSPALTPFPQLSSLLAKHLYWVPTRPPVEPKAGRSGGWL